MEKDMKRIVVIIVLLITLIAIPVTVFLSMRNQEIRKKAAPATIMTISPASVQKNVGDEFTLEVRMNTADNQVVAVQVSLAFDPEKLEAEWIHNGTMFPNIISSGVVGSGAASIALGAANTTTPVTGTGLVATLKMKALAATSSPVAVRFAADSFAGALGEGSVNVLTSTTPATITIQGSAGPTNPTATPALTPTGSIYPTATPTGSATSSAILITSPIEYETVSVQTPTVSGTAPPDSTVTIVIHSDEEITTSVTADPDGNWSYTLTEPLTSGDHTIIAAVLNPETGETDTATITFTVAGSDDELTGEDMPVSGTVETTLLLLGLGTLLLFSGLFIPVAFK